MIKVKLGKSEHSFIVDTDTFSKALIAVQNRYAREDWKIPNEEPAIANESILDINGYDIKQPFKGMNKI